ncbi:hypothetical protein TNCV_1949031, partial [Trichonephila clavipes]
MRGTLTGQCYVDILRPHVGPFLNGLPGAIFQQDNARPHTARELLKTSHVIFRLFHGRPAPPIPQRNLTPSETSKVLFLVRSLAMMAEITPLQLSSWKEVLLNWMGGEFYIRHCIITDQG